MTMTTTAATDTFDADMSILRQMARLLDDMTSREMPLAEGLKALARLSSSIDFNNNVKNSIRNKFGNIDRSHNGKERHGGLELVELARIRYVDLTQLDGFEEPLDDLLVKDLQKIRRKIGNVCQYIHSNSSDDFVFDPNDRADFLITLFNYLYLRTLIDKVTEHIQKYLSQTINVSTRFGRYYLGDILLTVGVLSEEIMLCSNEKNNAYFDLFRKIRNKKMAHCQDIMVDSFTASDMLIYENITHVLTHGLSDELKRISSAIPSWSEILGDRGSANSCLDFIEYQMKTFSFASACSPDLKILGNAISAKSNSANPSTTDAPSPKTQRKKANLIYRFNNAIEKLPNSKGSTANNSPDAGEHTLEKLDEDLSDTNLLAKLRSNFNSIPFLKQKQKHSVAIVILSDMERIIVDIAACLPSLRCLQSTLLHNHSERQLLNDDEDVHNMIVPEEDDLSDLLHRMNANNNDALNGESQTIMLSDGLFSTFRHVYGELRFLSEVIHSDESKHKVGIVMKFSLLKIGESFRGINKEINKPDQSDLVRHIVKEAPLLNRALQETVLSRNDGIAHDVLGYEDEPHFNTIINQTLPLLGQIKAILVLSSYHAPPSLTENGTISIQNYQYTHREVVESYIQLAHYAKAKCHIASALDEIARYRTQEDLSAADIKNLESNEYFINNLLTSVIIESMTRANDRDACRAELKKNLTQFISHGIEDDDPIIHAVVGHLYSHSNDHASATKHFHQALNSCVDRIRNRQLDDCSHNIGPKKIQIESILIANAVSKAHLNEVDEAQDALDNIINVEQRTPMLQYDYHFASAIVKLQRCQTYRDKHCRPDDDSLLADFLGAVNVFSTLHDQLPMWEGYIKTAHTAATYLNKKKGCVQLGIKCFEVVTEKMLDQVQISALGKLLAGILWLAKESPDFQPFAHKDDPKKTIVKLVDAARYFIKRERNQSYPVMNRSDLLQLACDLIEFIDLYNFVGPLADIYGCIITCSGDDVAYQDKNLNMIRKAITKAVEQQDCNEHIIQYYLVLISKVFGQENVTAFVDTFNYVDGVIAPHINDSTRFKEGLNQFKEAVRKKTYSFNVDTDKENTINTVSKNHDNVLTAVTSCTEIDIARKDSPRQHLANLGLMTRPLYRFTNALVSTLRNQIPSGTFWTDVRPNDSSDTPTSSLMFSCRKTFEADVHRVLDGDHEGVTETQRCYGTF